MHWEEKLTLLTHVYLTYVLTHRHLMHSLAAAAARSSMVFNVVPTALEVSLVAGILAYKCGPEFAVLTGGTIAAYTAFTFSVTQVRVLAGVLAAKCLCSLALCVFWRCWGVP